MTELQLFKFIQENKPEWHWEKNEGEDDVILFLYHWDLEEFGELIKDAIEEYPTICYFKANYCCFWMKSICDYFGIEIENVFPKP